MTLVDVETALGNQTATACVVEVSFSGSFLGVYLKLVTGSPFRCVLGDIFVDCHRWAHLLVFDPFGR